MTPQDKEFWTSVLQRGQDAVAMLPQSVREGSLRPTWEAWRKSLVEHYRAMGVDEAMAEALARNEAICLQHIGDQHGDASVAHSLKALENDMKRRAR